MSTFSKIGYKTLTYNSVRPQYPSSFYQILSTYITQGDASKLPVLRALDLGCGTGQATYPLLSFANRVSGIDLSPLMIETANSLIKDRCDELQVADKSRIDFKAGAVEDFVYKEPREIKDGTVDLITAAQCIHWFKDYDSFFRNSAKLLKSGGTLAYFFYVDPVVVDFSGPYKGDKAGALQKAADIYYKYMYNDPKFMGPHWEQPGRTILKDSLVEVNKYIPQDLFHDIEINSFRPDFSGVKTAEPKRDLDIKKEGVPISAIVDYINTFSGYHNFKEATGDKENLIESYLSELERELNWDRNTTVVDLVFNSGYTFIRKK